MRFIDTHGESVIAGKPRPTAYDGPAIERARDVHMLSMRRDGIPWRAIARYFGVSVATAKRRVGAIPREAERHYGRSLG